MSEPGGAAAHGEAQPVLETVLVPPPRPDAAFEIGRAIGRAFSTWRRNLVPFAVLGLVKNLPTLAFAILGAPIQGITAPAVNPFDLAAARAAPQPPSTFWLAYAAMALLLAWEIGAVTEGVLQHLAGRRPTLRAMAAAGLRRWLPVLGVALLSEVMMLTGFLFLVVPGVFLACALAAALPAAVAERPGVFGAVSRSFALTKGNRLAILVVGLVFLTVTYGVSIVTVYLLPRLTPFAPALGRAVGYATNVVLGTLAWVAPAVVYHDLRAAKEGRATAELEAVFE